MTPGKGIEPASWEVTAQAPAKLNLALEVVGKRPDGYHDLRTVFQAVDLSDRLRLRTRSAGVALRVRGEEPVPEGPENLVVRAARLLLERRAPGRGVEILLEKTIPAGAGLGGGSSDAAATLLGLERLWSLDPDPPERARLALAIGSDVPFFLLGGTALGEGRGEILRPLPPPPELGWLLAVPDYRISTRAAFGALEPGLTTARQQVTILADAIRSGDIRAFIDNLVNDLQTGVVRIQPRLARSKLELLSLGCMAVGLTGSGSALFGLFDSEGAVLDLLENGFSERDSRGFRRSARLPGAAVVPCRPVAFGARVVP